MTDLNRRDAIQLMTASAIGAALSVTPAEARRARTTQAARQAEGGKPYEPSFFTAHEYATISRLSSIIIPPDERSGGAVEAGVPEFIDFIVADQPERQTAMRGGLAWLDAECLKRFDRTFVDAEPAQQMAVLDDIAMGPELAKPQFSQGAGFFAAFRDLTATGFWTSKMGMADLQYQGNTFVAEWTGCPEPILKKLGLAVLATAMLASPALQASQATQAPSVSPQVDGKAVYAKHCQVCHADGNSPIEQMNFAKGRWKHGSRLDDIIKVVRDGVPSTAMIGFKDKLSAEEIRAVAKHVRAFDKSLEPEADGARD